MGELRIGIAGLGYWGPNVLRNFRALESCRVTAIADTDPGRVAETTRLYPDLRPHGSARALIDDADVDAVVLALPAAALTKLALAALDAGKHVLVEKPMAASLDEGRRLVDAASRSDRTAMVDFTFVYSPPVRCIASLMGDGTLGEPQYYQSTRINLGRFQPDVDVVWDLIVHDVAILASVLGRDPETVLATGRPGPSGVVDTAHVTLSYGDGFQAFVHASWMAPTKVRTALLSCGRGMVLYDDVHPDEKIRIYQLDQHFDPGREDAIAPTFRLGEVRIPRLASEEPLRAMAATFVDAALGGPAPVTDWRFGLRVLCVLEAARRSLHTGEAVPVSVPAAVR